MNRIKLLALGVLIATSATAVQAESKLTLGAGVGIVEHPYKQYDHDLYPVPVINYEGDNFWFRGLGGGYYLWNDGTDQLSVMGYWSPMYFKPGDSDNSQLRKLDKRKSTVMAGVSWMHHTQYGSLRTALSGDILDNSNGVVWDTAWVYRYTNGGLTLTPGIGVEWNSENQNQYYYGVSHHEAAKSGLRSYDPSNSWNPYLELTANYRFANSWSVYGTARYTRLSDEITDSPMVDKSWTGLLSTGVTYTF
ncbi:MipA/OmpV family protein [Kluyvera ascorbata]|uniref:MipA/OmpV family protein n=1 Tax=Kluyvera ascorbata TaxID=51288 RepID=A0A378GQI4_9ENTR|nr:MipA/OmpV family protein [Kluyvera ascorbata]BBV66433.1 outer membrane protein [Klebsiella sp. STW0522-44]HEB4875663.1 MipA/OmpV family protein [Kluyvera ascorbata F0526]EJG2386456.1 MipA/OmpV family protein [Kluyvera ascorbata]KFD02546.1 MltA-interacting protein [Kluyvera ascorbata ATCC 33433]MDT8701580.1 MipA/OmpV family protein [Kluyvera ascorbata]